MTARFLPGTTLRVRRGRRHDVPQMEAVLGIAPGERPAKLFRRVIADLGSDVYVAENAEGEIVGVISVVYARSLVRGGLSALLDGARARHRPARALLDGLLAFAEERARRRGCRRLAAWVDAADDELRDALLARGYRAGELLVSELSGGAGGEAGGSAGASAS